MQMVATGPQMLLDWSSVSVKSRKRKFFFTSPQVKHLNGLNLMMTMMMIIGGVTLKDITHPSNQLNMFYFDFYVMYLSSKLTTQVVRL